MAASSKKPVLLVVILVVVLGIPAALWLARGVIATSMARDELDRRGLVCDERFSLEVSALFDEATIGPTRCTRAEGIVEAIELLEPVTVQLDGVSPESVAASSVRLTLRDRDVRGGESWARELSRLRLEQRVAGLIKGLSELSAMSLPPTTVGQVEVIRAGERIATAEQMVLRPGASLGADARRISFVAGPGGVGRLELTAVTGQATRPSVHLEGRASASAGIGPLSVTRSGTFAIDATALDTASPRFNLDARL
ncbi:MAG: hypothetical protein RLP09_50035 [Sandaracinaceae bacterium]